MNTTSFTLQRRVEPVVLAALKRGVRSQRDLEIIVAVELALQGYELVDRLVVREIVHGSGTKYFMSVEVRPIPHTVVAISAARKRRVCHTCRGTGCFSCHGYGWKPLSAMR